MSLRRIPPLRIPALIAAAGPSFAPRLQLSKGLAPRQKCVW